MKIMSLKRNETDLDIIFSALAKTNNKERSKAISRLKSISKDLSPDEYLLSRIIEGDKSDNIIGVEGIGPKRAQGLAKEHKTFETLLKSLPVKGRAKYIQNLNASRDVLERNEKLISLKKYNEDAIISGKYGEENLDELNSSYSA